MKINQAVNQTFTSIFSGWSRHKPETLDHHTDVKLVVGLAPVWSNISNTLALAASQDQILGLQPVTPATPAAAGNLSQSGSPDLKGQF